VRQPPSLGDRFVPRFDPTCELNNEVVGVRRFGVITGAGGRRAWMQQAVSAATGTSLGPFRRGCRSFGRPYSAAMRSHAISRYSSLSPARRGGGVRIMRSPSKRTPRA